jgi:hypothetical protein
MNAAYAACTAANTIGKWFFDVFDRVIPKALTTGAKILSDECFKQANEIRASYMDYYLLDMPEKVDSTVV